MKRSLLLLMCALALGCTDGRSHAQAICVLVDVSGTYADQKAEVVRIVRTGLLPKMEPGDSLILVRIDSRSYEADNVIASVHLPARPSEANASKLMFARKLDALAEDKTTARHTDVTGAMMLGSELLRETGAGHQVLVVFSDMKEELPPGVRRSMKTDELAGQLVVAMNVKKLRSDNANPAAYRKRLADWGTKVRSSGATDWTVVMDSTRLLDVLAQARK